MHNVACLACIIVLQPLATRVSDAALHASYAKATLQSKRMRRCMNCYLLQQTKPRAKRQAMEGIQK